MLPEFSSPVQAPVGLQVSFTSTENLQAAVLLALSIGVISLLLLSFELGGRLRLSLSAKLALAMGLGFGVIAFSVKVIILFTLNALNDGERRLIDTSLSAVHNNLPDTHGRAYATRSPFASWHTLPKAPPVPADNPQSDEKIALGRKLFHDPNLSLNRTISCASCHIVDQGGDDNNPVSVGISGLIGNRNAPTVINSAYLSRLFWDGRAGSLEEQVLGPLLNPVEMGMKNLSDVMSRVNEDTDYAPMFAEAFPKITNFDEPMSAENLAKAIAAYERTLVATDSPYDRFVAGDDSAMTARQLRGMAKFQKTGCRSCHLDPTFSSAGLTKPFGTYRLFPVFRGRESVNKYDLLIDNSQTMIRVPSLRNVEHTAPYFHNGSVKDLKEAVRVMAEVQLNKSVALQGVQDIEIAYTRQNTTENQTKELHLEYRNSRNLSEQDVDDIAAFLTALSDKVDNQ